MAETTREWYLRAARELAGTSLRQVEWCLGVADDTELIGLLDAVPRSARQPSLLFAVAAVLGAPDADYAAWAGWLRAHADALTAELPRRRVQTNEPGRAVPLLAGLARIPGPIALIELGASAGLCLLVDAYGYRFRTPSGTRVLGDGPPVLEAELDGDLVPDALPEVRWRRGLDLAPLAVTRDDDVRWLEASLPPDRPERRQRLAEAVSAARAHPPIVVEGDAIDGLAALAGEAPADATLVVASLGTAVYLPPADRERLLDVVAALGARSVTFEARSAIPAVRARWDRLVVDGRADADAAFLLALDGVPIASGSPHGDRLTSVRPVGALGELELRVLAFERDWNGRVGAKSSAIRAEFRVAPARYYQMLSAILDSPAALRHDALLVRRLQRVRDARVTARAARTLRIETQDPIP